MNRRLALAVVAVGALVALAGCSVLFGGISDSALDREASYDDLRERNSTVAIDVEAGGYLLGGGEFRAVYDLEGTGEVSLYRTGLYRDRSIDIHSVRYWYPNGTELTGSALEVDQGRARTDVRVPDPNGTLALTGDAGTRSVRLPATVEGSYSVSLPEGHRTAGPLFGRVRPGGFDREIVSDREWLTWEDLEGDLAIRYFLPRDVWIFGGFVVALLALGGAGLGYLHLVVTRIRERRRQFGLDDDGGEPPPGGG